MKFVAMQIYILRYSVILISFWELFLLKTESKADFVIQSPRITNWGIWGDVDSCPKGTYVTAMQIKVQKFQAEQYDDTAANGLRMRCAGYWALEPSGQINLTNSENMEVISSSVGSFGEWKENVYCDHMGVVVGFQLKVEKINGTGDNTATNDIRIVCGQYDRPLWIANFSYGERWGEYGTVQLCPPLMAVCGIRTQIDDPSAGGDETGLNNVDMSCCMLPEQAVRSQQNCSPVFDWSMIFAERIMFKNLSFDIIINQSLQWSWSFREKVNPSALKDSIIPFNDLIGKIIDGFGKHITAHNWSRKRVVPKKFMEKKSAIVDYNNRFYTTLYQPVGHCGWLAITDDCILKMEYYYRKDGPTYSTSCYSLSKAPSQDYRFHKIAVFIFYFVAKLMMF